MTKLFDFWNDHSDTFLRMANLWERRQVIGNADSRGGKTGDCGDTVTIFLSIKNDTIGRVNYDLTGCLNTNACCNALVILAEGRSLEEAWNITPADIIDFLETLPEAHYHCAELTIGSFYLALTNFNEDKKGG